jgi:hypothetical protein
MSVDLGFIYTLLYENQRLARRTRTSAATRRPKVSRWILRRRDRRVPRRHTTDSLALAGLVPRGRPRGGLIATRIRPSAQAHDDAREDHPTMADREPDQAWVRHRIVDRTTPRPTDPTRIRNSPQPAVPLHLDASPRLHPAEAPASRPRGRPRGGRRLAQVPMAAHQKRLSRRICGRGIGL